MTAELQQRIEDLEVHAAHQSEIIEALNDTVQKQWERIDLLTRQVEALTQQLLEVDSGAVPVTKPPHY